MVLLISSLVGLSQLIGRFTIAGCMSEGSSAEGLFSSSSKCSAHLLRFFSVPVMFLLCFSLTGRSGLLYLPDSFLVVAYSYLMIPLSAACSSSFARPLKQFQLSILTLFFTSLLAFVWYSCAFVARVWLLFIADFFSRSWILRQVSAVIQSFCCIFFRPTSSWQFDVSISLMFCHRLFRSGSSSYCFCNTWNLSARFSLYSSLVCRSFRRTTLYFSLLVADPI